MDATNNYVNYILSFLLRKIIVPSDYHSQVREIQTMLRDDVSGLVDSLTDFAVDSAVVEYNIVTGNDNLDTILKKWLETLNAGYDGQVPMGIRSLSKEYFKERWKNGSFPVLKMKWEKVNGLELPTKMFFVDGGSIHAKPKDDESDLSLLSYDYYIGKNFQRKYKLSGDTVIISRPYGRWFDKYPTPFLVKRGVFHNWKVVQSLKKKEIEILEQVIPYMLLVKKGTEQLATKHVKMYSDPELREVKRKFQKLMDDIQATKNDNSKTKVPTRVTNFDEEIQHIIPQLDNLFNPTLFASAERNILAGLGFIDVVEGVSTSRRESILNPKAFIEEVKTGVDDFKQILKYIIYKVIERNANTRNKYMNLDFYITSSPVRGFMTDDFKKLVRLMWKAGKVSSQTAVELIAEVDFRTEVMRMEKENDDGLRDILYPQLTENVEDRGKDTEIDKNGDQVPTDKQGDEKQDYDMGITDKDLEGAPYSNISQLPARVKNNMTKSLQRTFLAVVNNALKTYNGDETRAFKTAWAMIRKIAKKNKNGKWVKASARIKLTKSMIEEVLEEMEDDAIDQEGEQILDRALKEKKLENENRKADLLKNLLNKAKEE